MTTTDLSIVREAALDLALATWYDEALRLLDATTPATGDAQGRVLLALTAADVADRADHVFGRTEASKRFEALDAELAAHRPDTSMAWDVAWVRLRRAYSLAIRNPDGSYRMGPGGRAPGEADTLVAEAVRLRDAAPDEVRRGWASVCLGWITDNVLADRDAAPAHYEVGLAAARASGDPVLLFEAQRHLGDHAHDDGDLLGARERWEESTAAGDGPGTSAARSRSSCCSRCCTGTRVTRPALGRSPARCSAGQTPSGRWVRCVRRSPSSRVSTRPGRRTTPADGRQTRVTTMADTVRTGLVGAGPWASVMHAPLLAGGPGTSLEAVWARREDAATGWPGSTAPRWRARSRSCSSGATPSRSPSPDVQAALALRAAAAGRHLLLEKPLAFSSATPSGSRTRSTRQGPHGPVLTNRFTAEGRDSWPGGGGTASGGAGQVPWRRLAAGLVFATPWRVARGALLDLGPHVLDLLVTALGPSRRSPPLVTRGAWWP